MISLFSKFHFDIFDSFQIIILNKQFWQKVKKPNGYNSKTITFLVMPFVLQLHHVMMMKYTKFGVDAFNTFWSHRLHWSFCTMTSTTTMYDDLAIIFFLSKQIS